MIPYQQILTLGCDPEFFFADVDGHIVGSEKVLPERGLAIAPHANSTAGDREYFLKSQGAEWVRLNVDEGNPAAGGFVLDGVQVELNPVAGTCRAELARNIQACFIKLRNHLVKHPGISASFAPVVEVRKEELDSLSERSRTLGCAPSLNLHDSDAKVKVNAATYRTRSAGGHIHLGGAKTFPWLRDPSKMIPLLDVLVGNTCVLVDRNEANVERRKVYGRAGEYRLPPHGIEYRTLSNFWLRSYPLMSMVMGLARMVGNVVAHDNGMRPGQCDCESCRKSYPDRVITPQTTAQNLLSSIDMATVTAAINQNDLDLARVTWEKVKEWVDKHIGKVEEGTNNTTYACKGDYGTHPIAVNLLDDIEHFIERGLDYWFKEDPITHWVNLGRDERKKGWEHFLVTDVREDREKGSESCQESSQGGQNWNNQHICPSGVTQGDSRSQSESTPKSKPASGPGAMG